MSKIYSYLLTYYALTLLRMLYSVLGCPTPIALARIVVCPTPIALVRIAVCPTPNALLGIASVVPRILNVVPFIRKNIFACLLRPNDGRSISGNVVKIVPFT